MGMQKVKINSHQSVMIPKMISVVYWVFLKKIGSGLLWGASEQNISKIKLFLSLCRILMQDTYRFLLVNNCDP